MIKIFTEEEKNFIFNNYKGLLNKDLTEKVNKHFNKNFTLKQIIHFKRNNHLNSGLTCHFEKGHIPFCKGKKWDEYMPKESQERSLKTTYKKGNTPANSVPIGTEKWKKSHSGKQEYLFVKIQDKKGRFNWKEKHILIYEEKYGKIPKGYNVIFKDGNPHNIVLENLALVSDSELLIANKEKLISKNPKITESGLILAKYKDSINKKIKRRKKEKNK